MPQIKSFTFADPGNGGLSKLPTQSIPQISQGYARLIDQMKSVGSVSIASAPSPEHLRSMTRLATDLQRELAWTPTHFEPRPTSPSAVEQPLLKARSALEGVEQQLNAVAIFDRSTPGNDIAAARDLAQTSKAHWNRAVIAALDERVGNTLFQTELRLHDLRTTAEADPSVLKQVGPAAVQEQQQAISALERTLPPGEQAWDGVINNETVADANLYRAHQNVEALKHGLQALPLAKDQSEWIQQLDDLHSHAEAARTHWLLAGDLLSTS